MNVGYDVMVIDHTVLYFMYIVCITFHFTCKTALKGAIARFSAHAQEIDNDIHNVLCQQFARRQDHAGLYAQ